MVNSTELAQTDSSSTVNAQMVVDSMELARTDSSPTVNAQMDAQMVNN